MWVSEVLLAGFGLSCGMIIASGLFAFLVGLGIISDFADRTHTGEKVLMYEDSVVLGCVLGNAFLIFGPGPGGGRVMLAVFGLLAGMFVGCWAMALIEMLKILPMFMRKAGILNKMSWLILALALGKSLGALLYFYRGW